MPDRRRQAWPSTAAVEFGPDLWEAAQAAADRAGQSVEEYIREAVVARLAGETRRAAPSGDTRRGLMARRTAAARRSEAVALRAQAEQAVRHAGAVGRRSADALASGKAGLLRMFRGCGNDVLVEAEYGHDDPGVWTIWLLYRFDGDRLAEAIAFPDEAQAHEYSAAPASR